MKLRLQTWKRNYDGNQKQTTSYQRTQILRNTLFLMTLKTILKAVGELMAIQTKLSY